jgi:hypothetical protein
MENEEMAMQKIADRIYLIRGVKVMIDRDLAEMYGVKAIRLREQVKRSGTFHVSTKRKGGR